MKALPPAMLAACMFLLSGCGDAPEDSVTPTHAAHVVVKPGPDAGRLHAIVIAKSLAHGWRVEADGPAGIDLYRKHLRIRVTCGAAAVDIVQTGGAWDASPLIGALADDIGRASGGG